MGSGYFGVKRELQVEEKELRGRESDKGQELKRALSAALLGEEHPWISEENRALFDELLLRRHRYFGLSLILFNFLTNELDQSRTAIVRARFNLIYESLLSWMLKLSLIDDTAERTDIVHRLIDTALKRGENSAPEVSCKKSCSACCHTQITLAPSEARKIRAYAIESLEGIDFDRAKRQAMIQDPRLYPLQLSWRDSACIFLDDEGACSIYSVRPMSCRKILVLSDPLLCDPRQLNHPTYLMNDEAEIIASAYYNLERENSPQLTTISSFFADAAQSGIE